MNTERWQQIDQLLRKVLDLPLSERSAFLGKACAEDQELHREVESLVRLAEETGGLLSRPAIEEYAEELMGGPAVAKGQRLGEYEIVRQLGTGGMGEVFLARHIKNDRVAAVKILPIRFAQDPQHLRRFRQESRAVLGLNHPNIVTAYDIGETSGVRFIATEFVEGETLRERMKRGRLSLSEVVETAIQVVSALAYAHAHGLVHRDVKPENVMLRPDGYAKVLDFGIAKLTGPEAGELARRTKTNETTRVLSTPGMLIGTLPYMSPEQARGEELDARSDIFSFGVMLYEMASGQHPFQRDSHAETVSAILTHEPTFAESMVDSPEELRAVVRRCLLKDRTERYQEANELLLDLRKLRTHLDVATPTAIIGSSTDARIHDKETDAQADKTGMLPGGATQEVANRSRPRLVIICALVLLLLASTVVALRYLRARQIPFAVIEVGRITQATVWLGLDDYPSISPDGKSVAYCSDHDGSFEIYVKALASGAKETRLTNDHGQNFQPAWSPDGQQIAFYSKTRGGIWVVLASGGEARQLTEFGSAPAWSPDGKLIAFQSNPLTDLGPGGRNAMPPSTLWLVTTQGGEPRRVTEVGKPVGGHGAPSFSPDGKRLAFVVNEFNSATAWTVSVEGNDPKRLSPQAGSSPVYTHDGQSVLYVAGGVFQIQVSGRGEPIGEPTLIKDFVARPATVRRLSFSADGKKVAYSVLARSSMVSSVELRPGTFEAVGVPVQLIKNAGNRNNHVTFSPDGEHLAFTSCSLGESNCDIWLANADGSNQTQLTTGAGNEQLPGWFPDMQEVAFVSTTREGHVSLWAINISTKRERVLFDLPAGLDGYVRLSPDGQKVAFNYKGADGITNTWVAVLASGEKKQLTFDKERMGFPAWSPDSKYLAFDAKRGDDSNVMIMPSEGGTPTQLTFDHGQSFIFGWSPDGDKVLFAGFRDGLWNIWWVSRSTKQQKRLTDYKALNSFVRYPSWSPKGNQIAYEYSETTGNIWVADLK